MDAQEEKDLAKLQVKLNENARNCMDALRTIEGLDAEGLKHSGFKDTASAVLSQYQYYRKQSERLVEGHLKKYPDQT